MPRLVLTPIEQLLVAAVHQLGDSGEAAIQVYADGSASFVDTAGEFRCSILAPATQRRWYSDRDRAFVALFRRLRAYAHSRTAALGEHAGDAWIELRRDGGGHVLVEPEPGDRWGRRRIVARWGELFDAPARMATACRLATWRRGKMRRINRTRATAD